MKLHDVLELNTVNELKQLRGLIPLADRSTRKDDIVAAIAHHLLSADLHSVWERLSELEIGVIAESVHNWGGYFNRTRFKAKYGALPSSFYSRTYSWRDGEREKEPPSMLPLFLYAGEIPEDLRPRLEQLAPPPAEAEVATLTDEDLPEIYGADDNGEGGEPLRRVATEALVRHDLPAVLRLIAQGRITVGVKTGVPGKVSVDRLEQVLLGGDWYSAGEDLDLDRRQGGSTRPIRPFAWPLLLQNGGLVKQDGGKLVLTARGKKALSQPIEEVVSPLFDRWQAKGRPDELKRVDLIKGQGSKSARMSAVAERRGVIGDALTECCPVGGWIAIDELFRQMQMNGHSFEVSHNPWGLYFSEPQYGSLGYDGNDGFEILQARFILVYLFEYLATLGMIDIAYTGPVGARPDYHGAWGVDEFLFLSRYDGLRYIRLNALGAYCLGREIEYRPVLETTPHLFVAGEDLGLTLLREAQPAETLVLEQIATCLTRDLWQLNPDAVLTQSADRAERERIRTFLDASSDGALPPQVVQLLDTVAERATALSDAGAAHLIKCKDKAIAVMLASDPATAPHCIRAGDRLICVAEPKLAAFRKGLVRLGFVLPASFGE